jgi:twitching motility protein PilU
VADRIFKGDVAGLKEIMARSGESGMQTFDQALFALYESEWISYEDALRNADSKNELRLRLKLESKRMDYCGDEDAPVPGLADES